MSVEESFVLIETKGAVATLTLNRPLHFNVLSSGMLAALQTALDEVSADRSVRAVVLAAAGRAFCAGHDLHEMRSHPDISWQTDLFARCSRVVLTIVNMPQPVIARVQGVATAAGCQLVATCDLAIASRSSRFATSGVNLGLFCSTPAVAISRSIPPKQAAELLFMGEFITAAQAEQWGLVNRCVDDEILTQFTRQWAAVIAGKSGAAIALGKKLLRNQRNLSPAEAYVIAGENMAQNMMTEDAQRGIDAFLHKQSPPDWKHR